MKQVDNTEYALFEDVFLNFSKTELQAARESNGNYPFNDYPIDLLEKALALGMFGLLLPESAGGLGQSMQLFCKLISRLSETCASMACILLTHSLGQEILLRTNKIELLPGEKTKIENKKLPIIAFPAFDNPIETPPGLSARLIDGSYRLDGSLDYLSLGNLASHAVVPANTQQNGALSYFLIELGCDSIEYSDAIFGLGLNLCPAVDLHLNDVEAVLLTEAGEGEKLFVELSNKMSVAAAAISLGLMQGSLKEALEYSHQRMQGGRLICQWSEVAAILSDMTVSSCNTAMAVNSASAMVDTGAPGWQTHARAVCASAQELACEVTTHGIQVLGGYGYMKDYGQEKRFRDALHLQSLLGYSRLKKMDCLYSLTSDLGLNH